MKNKGFHIAQVRKRGKGLHVAVGKAGLVEGDWAIIKKLDPSEKQKK